MIKAVVVSLLFFAGLPAFAQDKKTCSAKGSAEIVKIFKEGRGLNQRFKETVAGPGQGSRANLRAALEQYDESRLMPCVRHAAQRLAAHADPVLMHELLVLVISYENSADETLSYAMGSVFGADPAAVERALKAFPAADRKRVHDRIQAGWANVKLDLPPALRKNRDARLANLLASGATATGAAR
jgi:hypothetical protein